MPDAIFNCRLEPTTWKSWNWFHNWFHQNLKYQTWPTCEVDKALSKIGAKSSFLQRRGQTAVILLWFFDIYIFIYIYLYTYIYTIYIYRHIYIYICVFHVWDIFISAGGIVGYSHESINRDLFTDLYIIPSIRIPTMALMGWMTVNQILCSLSMAHIVSYSFI